MLGWCLADVFHRNFGNSRDRAPIGSLWTKDYRIMYFLVCRRRATIFFDKGLRCLVCFLRKLWVWEKIYLKFVKSWEMKNLPCYHEKGSETVLRTVKPWELRSLMIKLMELAYFWHSWTLKQFQWIPCNLSKWWIW